MSTSEAEGLHAARDFEGLRALSESGGVEDRRMAVRYLGALRRQHIVDALERALLDEEESVRIDAARALSSVGGDRAVAVLLGASGSSDNFRAAIVRALGVLGDSRGLRVAAGGLNADCAAVRATAARALGRIGTPEAVEPLTAALNDDARDVRSRAREALISIGQPRGLDALKDNGRRATVMRWLDVRAGALPAKRVADREHGRVPLTADRLTTRLLVAAVKALLCVAFMVWVDVVVIDARAVPLVVAALVTAGVFGTVIAFSDADEHLDVVRWRAETGAGRVGIAPRWQTTTRMLAGRPLALAAFVAAPLALDVLLGGYGVLPGVFVGLLLAVAASRAVDAMLLSHWQDHSGEVLCIDAGPDPIRRHRIFSRTSS